MIEWTSERASGRTNERKEIVCKRRTKDCAHIYTCDGVAMLKHILHWIHSVYFSHFETVTCVCCIIIFNLFALNARQRVRKCKLHIFGNCDLFHHQMHYITRTHRKMSIQHFENQIQTNFKYLLCIVFVELCSGRGAWDDFFHTKLYNVNWFLLSSISRPIHEYVHSGCYRYFLDMDMACWTKLKMNRNNYILIAFHFQFRSFDNLNRWICFVQR